MHNNTWHKSLKVCGYIIQGPLSLGNEMLIFGHGVTKRGSVKDRGVEILVQAKDPFSASAKLLTLYMAIWI